jgi:AcrR family transcriptional regulator
MVTRDSKGTQTKILAAATQAFVALGPAGARVDAIAAAAGVNKRMLYHHFGDKQGLYQAVLVAAQDEVGQVSAERARLLAWEGLLESTSSASQVLDDADLLNPLEGSASPPMGVAIEPLAEPNANYGPNDNLDAPMLQLLHVALQVFPYVFGPEVKRLTGMTPGSDAFEAALGRLRDQVESRMTLGSAAPAAKVKVTLRARTTARTNSGANLQG